MSSLMTESSDRIKEEVRDRTDIVELVREYLPNMRRKGRAFWACCPFHQEKTASFQVNPEMRIFHCFGCGVGGDVFSFVMKLEGLTFPEALEKLGERVGIRVEFKRRPETPEEKERVKLKELLESAAEYYHGVFQKAGEAKAARDYVAKRKISEETVERFRLGFAPRGGGLLEKASKKGYGPEILIRAGLAAKREDRVRDFFWSRVLFPIRNGKGETVGFGGRILDDGNPKYLNSPDSPWFSKRKILYGLFEGLPEMRKSRHAILLEGYTDVLAAHQHGITNACATLGTALTEDHVALLKRYADSMTIVFDPDAAGAAAALRGAELVLSKGLTVSIATLPDGLDPDEFLHERGPAAFRDALVSADDLASFRTRLLLKGRALPLSPQDKSTVAGEVLQTVRLCPDEVLKAEWLRRLADAIGADEAGLRLQLDKGGVPTARPRREQPSRAASRPLPPQDRDIMLCLIRSPGLAAADEKTTGDILVDEEDFSDERARSIFRKMRELLDRRTGGGDGEGWADRLLELLEGADAALARELFCDEREVKDPAQMLGGIVGRERRQRRLDALEPRIRSGKASADEQQEYMRLLVELKGTRRGER